MSVLPKKLIILLPTLVVVLCILFLVLSLEKKESYVAKSPLQGKEIPRFNLPALHQDKNQLDTSIFSKKKGEFTLLNVWASWCVACKTEHDFLVQLKQHKGINIVGLNYRDKKINAASYLQKNGDPYQKVIFDHKGALALDLGVVATPETYLIDHNGIIQFRYTGTLNEKIWNTQFVPLIQQLENTKQVTH